MRNPFQFTWWKYLAAILIPIILWCSIFDILARPAKNERLYILYVGDHLDSLSLQQQVTDRLPTLTEQPIRDIRVDAVSQMDSVTVLTARTFDYDLLIFEESKMLPYMGIDAFASFSDRLIGCFPNVPHYTEDTDAGTLVYGLLLHSDTSSNPFSSCYSGQENCYLFLSPQSENFDTLNQRGVAGDDAALQTAQFLLEMTP